MRHLFRGGRRCAGALLAAVAMALAPVPLTAGSAQAATCGTSGGVSVVVQFPDGHTESGCAAGDPGSGLAALQGAGFAYSFDSRNPGFVCTIKGAPASRNCMKPDYWAYFHDTGHGWVYSTEGAATYDPPAGSSEGWRFGSGSAPGARAPVRVTPKPSPSPTQSSGSGHAGGSIRSSAGPSPTASATSPTVSASPSASAHARVGRSAKASRSAAAVASPSAVDPTVSASTAQAEVASDETDDSGSLSWVWGVGLLVVVGAGAGVVTVVRRRSA